MTKEEYTKIRDDYLANPKHIDDQFLTLMHKYYLHFMATKRPQQTENGIKEFIHFKELFKLFISIPVTYGDTPQEIAMNVRNQTFNKGINDTINHFNILFGI